MAAIKPPPLVLPTGFEADQKKAARKRKIAEMMLAKSQQGGNMTHWSQALASVAQAGVGKHLDKKADNIELDMQEKLKTQYADALAQFSADEKGLDPTALVQKYRGNPLLEGVRKPYEEAMTARLRGDQNLVNNGGRWQREGSIEEGSYEPSKPTDATIRLPNGDWATNDVATIGALARQGAVGTDGRPISMRAPDPTQAPLRPAENYYPQAVTGQPPTQGNAAPVQGAPPAGGGLDLSLLKPEEIAIMQRELARRGGQGGVAGYRPPNPNVPMGNPLSAAPAPSGMTTDGKPYWIVNGVPYDNPEGK